MNWLTQPLERVFLRPLRSLGGLSFDVVVSEEHEDTLTIAKSDGGDYAEGTDYAVDYNFTKGTVIITSHAKQNCRTLYDIGKLFCIVKLQTLDNAETISQRCGKRACSCGSAYKSELVKLDPYRPCRRTFAHDYIKCIILQSRIKHLLHLS